MWPFLLAAMYVNYWNRVMEIWLNACRASIPLSESKEKKMTPITAPRRTAPVRLGLKESIEEIHLIWNSNLTANIDTMFSWSLEVMESVTVPDAKKMPEAKEEIFHAIENFCLLWVDERWCKPTSHMAYT